MSTKNVVKSSVIMYLINAFQSFCLPKHCDKVMAYEEAGDHYPQEKQIKGLFIPKMCICWHQMNFFMIHKQVTQDSIIQMLISLEWGEKKNAVFRQAFWCLLILIQIDLPNGGSESKLWAQLWQIMVF